MKSAPHSMARKEASLILPGGFLDVGSTAQRTGLQDYFQHGVTDYVSDGTYLFFAVNQVSVQKTVESENYVHFVSTFGHSHTAFQFLDFHETLGGGEASGDNSRVYSGDGQSLLDGPGEIGIYAYGRRRPVSREMGLEIIYFPYQLAYTEISVGRLQRGQIGHAQAGFQNFGSHPVIEIVMDGLYPFLNIFHLFSVFCIYKDGDGAVVDDGHLHIRTKYTFFNGLSQNIFQS